MKKVNADYLNIFKEPLLFIALILRHALGRRRNAESDAILIVNVCLIGDFAASAPALHAYISRQEGRTIDMLVSPPLKTLAERVRGVRAVYTAASVFARELEQSQGSEQHFGAYKKVLALRISRDAYRTLGAIETKELQTGLPHLLAYGLHLAWNLLVGKTPRPWRDINFDMVGEIPRNVPFGDIFNIPDADYARVRSLPALQGAQKKILIHTGASWVMNHWSADKWVELIKKLHALGDFRFIFVGAKKDEEEYQYISSRLPFPTYSLIGQIGLLDLTLAMRAGDYFIGVDSGPRNLAHLAGLPSITLLGPGPHMFTPPDARDIILDRSKGRGFYQRFFHTKSQFIDKIQPDDVIRAFRELTTRSGPGTGSRP
jgi:ADP-heptose:LPS heptosyltransferase